MKEPNCQTNNKTTNDSSMNPYDLSQILREEILGLILKPGELISENNISRRFCVSRTIVRSCFERLKQEGFLEVIPKKGSFVSLIDLDEAEQIIFMRIQVEATAMSYLCLHKNPILFERLSQNLEQQLFELEQNSIEKSFYKLDSQFHGLCLASLGKEKLWQIIENMQIHYTRYRKLDYIATHQYSTLYTEHANLLDCMKGGSSDDIRHAITAHLYGGYLRIGNNFATEYKDYFTKTTRTLDDILLDIKKQISESNSFHA